MFCINCGKELNDQAVICPSCGVPTDNFTKKTIKSKKKTTYLASKDLSSLFAMLFTILNYVSVSLISIIIFLAAFFWVFYFDSFNILLLYLAILTFLSSGISFFLSFFPENKEKRFISDVLFIASSFSLIFVIIFCCLW